MDSSHEQSDWQDMQNLIFDREELVIPVSSSEESSCSKSPFTNEHSNHSRLPFFTKTNGETIVLFTELYYKPEKTQKDYDFIRKRKRYKTQLLEFHTEVKQVPPFLQKKWNPRFSDNYEQKQLQRLLKEFPKFQVDWWFPHELPSKPLTFLQDWEHKVQLGNSNTPKPKKRSYLVIKKQNQNLRVPQNRPCFPVNYQGNYQPPKQSSVGVFLNEVSRSKQQGDYVFGFEDVSFGFYETPVKKHYPFKEATQTTSRNTRFFSNPNFSTTKHPNLFQTTCKPQPIPPNINPYYKEPWEGLAFLNKFNPLHQNLHRKFFKSYLGFGNNQLLFKTQPKPSFSEQKSYECPDQSVTEKHSYLDLPHSNIAYLNSYFRTPVKSLQSFHRPFITIKKKFSPKNAPKLTPNKHPDPLSYTKLKDFPDISCKESNFILIEYVEQYPLLLNIQGMAGKLEFQSFLENYSLVFETQLCKSRVYKHSTSDLLLIRNQESHGEHWFIREIPNIFLSGQLFPKLKVYMPESKEATNFFNLKTQLHITKLLQSYRKFTTSDLVAKLNLSKQKVVACLRLLQCTKTDNKYWSLPHNFSNAEGNYTPENLCCYETMEAYQKHLELSGISITNFNRFKSAAYKLLEETQDPRQRKVISCIINKVSSAPWHLSSNFLDFTNGKCCIEVKGPSDPTNGKCGVSFGRLKNSYKKKEIQKLMQKATEREKELLGKGVVSEEDELFLSESELSQSSIDEQHELQLLTETLNNFNNPQVNRKLLKRVTKMPLPDGTIKVTTEYFSDKKLIEKYYQKQIDQTLKQKTKEKWEKKFMKTKLARSQKTQKPYKPKKPSGTKKLEGKVKNQEKKQRKAVEKQKQEEEWKEFCLKARDSGALLFNTGRNENITCSICKMKGHKSNNKKVCPLYGKVTVPSKRKRPKTKQSTLSFNHTKTNSRLTPQKIFKMIFNNIESLDKNRQVSNFASKVRANGNPKITLQSIGIKTKHQQYSEALEFLSDLESLKGCILGFYDKDHPCAEVIQKMYDTALTQLQDYELVTPEESEEDSDSN